MCGIVAYVGPSPAYPIVIEGLKRLEYRGYDSAGVAVFDGEQTQIRRAEVCNGVPVLPNGRLGDCQGIGGSFCIEFLDLSFEIARFSGGVSQPVFEYQAF